MDHLLSHSWKERFAEPRVTRGSDAGLPCGKELGPSRRASSTAFLLLPSGAAEGLIHLRSACGRVELRTAARRLVVLAAVIALAYTGLLAAVGGLSAESTLAAWMLGKLFPGAYVLALLLAVLGVVLGVLAATAEPPRREAPWDADPGPGPGGYWSR